MPRAILSQATINYTKLGSWTEGRQPLVFVHGLASSSGFWFLAAELLGRSSPVVLFDLRGHGRSSIPAIGYCIADHAGDVIELLDYLAISSAVLIGHSFGGAVALQAALRRPERFSHLALADTRLRLFQPALTPGSWPKWREQKALLEGLGVVVDEAEAGVSLLTVLARITLQTGTGVESSLPRWMIEYFGQRQSSHAAGRWIELVEKTSLLADIRKDDGLTLDVLRDFPVPMLGVYGSHSPLLPSGLQLREARPQTRVIVVEAAGHFFPAVRPRAFTDPLEAFLR